MRDNPYTAVIIAASRRSGHAADARAGFSAVIRSAYPSSSRDAGLVPDLTCWIHRVRSSVQVALQDFEQRFGYPPDHNVLMDAATRGGSAMAEALRSRVSVPSAVVEFFDLVEELSLPDVWNGYFLGPASRVTATYVDESPRWLAASDGSVREVLVIGSDGGGALYCLDTEDPCPVFRVSEAGITGGVASLPHGTPPQIAPDFPAFLDALAAAIESVAANREPGF